MPPSPSSGAPGSARHRGLRPAFFGGAAALVVVLISPRASAGGRIVPIAGGAWPVELREDLEIGLAALPATARRFPGGDLEIEVHPEAAPFGLGDGSVARPEFTDGLRRFHLYRYLEPDEPRALTRLRHVAPALRERLWRQRAVVHAVIRRWDEHLRWSARKSWRQIVGWLGPRDRAFRAAEEAQNVYDWAFSRRRGRDAAALDLATFAEEALVPAESLDPGVVPVDDTVRCQEFSKSRFLAGALAGLDRDPALAAATRASLAPGRCPAFDAWADIPALSHLEVMLAAPAGHRPESLFGHVLLRAVHRPGALVRPPSAEQVLEIAAVTGVTEGGLEYISKGATGGFLTVFAHSSHASVQQKNLEIEQRDLRRFRLALSRDEELRVLQRVWELERRGYFRYYFLDENCASMLVFLLAGALDEDRGVELPSGLFTAPSEALDEIARATIETRRPGGGVSREPLLVLLPGEVRSLRQVATDADVARAAAAKELASLSAPETAARWRELHRQASRAEPRQRLAAYEALPPLADATLVAPAPAAATAERLRRLVREYLLASLRIERYAAAVAEQERSTIDRKAIVIPPELEIPSAEDLVLARQRQFEREDAAARQEEDVERTLAFEDLVASLPRRPLSAEEKARVAEADAASATYRRVAEIHGALSDRHFPAHDHAGALAAEARAREADAADRNQRALDRSGFGRSAVALGVGAGTGLASGPVVALRSSIVRELLGDQRQRGLGAHTELRLVDGELQLGVRPDGPEIRGSEVTVARFRTLRREPASLQRRLRDRWGWEIGLGTAWRRGASVTGRTTFDLGFLGMLGATSGLERFTVVGLGAALDADATKLWPSTFTAGPRVSLLHRSHLGGRFANALHLEAAYLPRFDVIGDDLGRLSQRASVRMGIDLHFGSRQRGVLVGPALSGGWEAAGGRTETRFLGVLGVELL